MVDPSRGLAHAAVRFARPSAAAEKQTSATPPPKDVSVSISACALDQRTIVARTGDRLVLHNRDDRFHALGLSLLDGGREDRAQTLPLSPKEEGVHFTLGAPGFYRIQSDQLPWMTGLLLVLAPGEEGVASGLDGGLAVSALPTGAWNVTVRHEVLGEGSTTVDVAANEAAAIYVELGGSGDKE
ncbi:MAG: hypothetical protein KDA24_01445 [Deltaproteobacteria bacterium]|nr:hypothetical protein [Deltaproteobacteria bacterium]